MSRLWCTLDFWPATRLWPANMRLLRGLRAKGQTQMKYFLRAFTPTKNRRLNELVGFLLFVSATLLFLALASYSPLDPSLNTAGSFGCGAGHKRVGLVGGRLRGA